MRKELVRGVLISLALTALSAVYSSEHAYARSAGASIGRAVSPADAGCFFPSGAGIWNSCGSAKAFEIVLIIDDDSWGQTKKPKFTASWTGFPATNCSVASRSWDGTVFQSSNTWTDNGTVGNGFELFTATNGVFMPGNSYLTVTCSIPANKVLQFLWW